MRHLLLADLDGTLVDSKGDLWPEAYSIAKQASSANWVIALCSARSTWSVEAIAERLGTAVGYIVSFQGAEVLRRAESDSMRLNLSGDKKAAWRTVRRHFLDASVAPYIGRLIPPTDSLWWYTEKEWWVRKIDEAAILESQAVQSEWSGVGKPKNHDRLIKLLVVSHKHAERRLQELRSAGLPISWYASQSGYIEIVSGAAGTDKGASDLRTIERDGQHLPFTVAIGDSHNDIGMLAASDIALTFEDASVEVRRSADVVLSSDRNTALRRLRDLLLLGRDGLAGLRATGFPFLERF